MKSELLPRIRLLLVIGLLGMVFYAGNHLFAPRTAAPVHPLTGRQIAGIATDASWLDRRSREQEEAPERALALIGIERGMIVADIGAGSGYMTVRLARLVGPSGKVYANDIQPKMLQLIRQKVDALNLPNVETVQGSDVDPHLPEGSIDLALLVDVYHELWHPQEMLKAINRALKPGGRIVLVEYRKEDPSIPIAGTHRMSVAGARAEVEAEGFMFDRVIPDLPRQHIIVFRK